MGAANPYRGEVMLRIDGENRVMRLTLGALAELEARLEASSFVEIVTRFERGTFAAKDVVGLLTAGLNGGGWEVSEDEIMRSDIDGGPLGAARAAAALLKVTFTIPEEGGSG